MIIQIRSFSIHQNAKVASILVAISVAVFMLPFTLLTFVVMSYIPESEVPFMISKFFIFMLPVIYLVISYLAVLIAALIYNFISKFIGGFEFVMVKKITEK